MKPYRAIAVLAFAVTVLLPGCGIVRVCPVTVAQATSGDFTAITPDTFVGVGRVIRYVPSPATNARGYDVSVVQAIQGLPPDGVLFVSAAEPYPAIGARDPVLILGAVESRRVLTAGDCPALQLIDESDLDG